MKKQYRLENLDCPNCANKIERAIGKLPGVAQANVNFFAMQLSIDAEESDFAAILPAAEKAAKRIEPDLRILPL